MFASQIKSLIRRHMRFAINVGLVAMVIAAYWPVVTFDFVNFDDGLFVFGNAYLEDGLTWAGVRWAFTTLYAAFWHPLTWLSLLADYELFGLWAGGYHLTNLALHAANTVALFLALCALLTAAPVAGGEERQPYLARCALVAALFAIHPLHVESVAWISERKDVLSTLFWYLGLAAYARYAVLRSWRRYLVVLGCLALGLMAKSMLVTFPCCLLLLDLWPLDRFRPAQTGAGLGAWVRRAGVLLIEKAPMFGLAAIFIVLSIVAQRNEQALSSFEGLPMTMRIENALVSSVAYLGQTFWPAGLAAFYPHPRDTLGAWEVAGAAGVLALLSAGAVLLRRRAPYALVGWLWFVVTLVPVSGLIQVGTHARADRYTYVPLVGLFIVAAWGLPQLVGGRRGIRTALPIVWAIAIGGLVVGTALQVRHWRNTEALFAHAAQVTRDNYLAHGALGKELLRLGRYGEADGHFCEALRIRPYDSEAQYGLATARLMNGQPAEAARAYVGLLEMQPDSAEAHHGLAAALLQAGDAAGALLHAKEAVKLRPDWSDAWVNLGAAWLAKGQAEQAREAFARAVAQNPNDADAHNNLGLAYEALGRRDEAAEQFGQALRCTPGHVGAQRNLERIQAVSAAPLGAHAGEDPAGVPR